MLDESSKTCPFCQKLPDDFFMQSEHFGAIYNIAPILPGHSLIIPTFHHTSMISMPDDLLCEMMLFSKKVAQFLSNVFESQDFDWAIQEGKLAGQSVQHLHLHLLPRKPNDLDDPGSWYREIEKNYAQLDVFEQRKLDENHLSDITARLKKEAFRKGF